MAETRGLPPKLQIEKLTAGHDPSDFDCGSEPLNTFIRLRALTGQRSSVSQTYVAANGNTIAGYHTLVVGSVHSADAPERLAKGLPRNPIPVILLARLAVDRRCHGQKLGAALVADAMLRVLQVADIAGAGDTTIGTMALALVCGATDVEAAELANLAGACVVRKHGVATITPDELLRAI